MAHIGNNKGFKLPGSDPDKTGDLSAAAKAAVKPTRRSARGSDVAKQEKQERKARRSEQKAAKAEAKVVASSRASHARADATASHASRALGDVGSSHGAARRSSRGRSTADQSGNRRIAVPGFSSLRAKTANARAGVSSGTSTDSETQRAFLKYANDNAVVRWFYQLVTGPQRHLFYLVVGVFFFMGLYLPVRDFYIANRTEQILQEQKAIRDKYNDSLGKEVKGYMSQEGVEDSARKDLGMVLPGEETITVEGLDEEGNPVVVQEGAVDQAAAGDQDGASSGESGDGADADSAGSDGSGENDTATSASSGRHGAQGAEEEDSGKLKGADAADKSKTGLGTTYDPSKEPTTPAEVEAAERAVFENSPWYWRLLDAVFFFDGANGMAVVSTGK